MSNKVVTLLEDAGKKILSFLKVGLAVAVDAEPIVAVAFPGIATLFNATVAAIGNAEAAGQAASSSAANGPAKLASVLAAIEPLAVAYLQEQGITASSAQIEAWVNAIVEALNSIPAATPASAVLPTLTSATQGSITVETTK